MAVNPFIDNLCQKAQEVFKILEESDCNSSDDTYLDHMIAGIKNEMTQYDNSNECLEFYRKSQCSRFVKSFKTANTGCQNFILKLLEEICMIHPDIQKEALQVALYVIENFETNKKGIFAVGDICSYPGKLKLILSGFHEVALASVECFKRARPNEKYRFEFTTSSKTIKDRLGVKGD